MVCNLPLSASGKSEPGFNYLKNYPEFQEVVEYFFIQYQPGDYQAEFFYQFRFARKPSGWFVYSDSYHNNTITQDSEIHLWKPGQGYLGLDSTLFTTREINSPGLMSKVLTNKNRYDFTIYPFYGYVGWEKDVIKYYKKKKIPGLSQNEIYGISKAYSALASNMFWSHGLYSDPLQVKAKNANKKDLRFFMKNSESAVRYLENLDSEYRTLTGLSDLKTGIELVARWYELALFGFHKEADDYLKNYRDKNVFDKFWIESSAYILNNLEPNSILFSFGDADTYPHLWNQAVNKIRPDILIINLSLLKDPIYFNGLSGGFLESPALDSVLSENQCKMLQNRVLVANNSSSYDRVEYPEIFKELISNLESDEVSIGMNFGYMNIPFTNEKSQPDNIKILNATKRQIGLNQFILQSILFHHFKNRRVYFTKRMSEDISKMFNPETLLDEGFVVRLDSKARDYSFTGYSYYDKEKLKKIIQNKPVEFPNKKYFARSRFYNLILEMESTLIIEDKNESDEIHNIEKIMSFLKNYPPQEAGISIPYLNMILSLFYIDHQREVAEMFLRAYLVELEFQIRATNLADGDPSDLDHLKYLEFIIEYIYGSKIEPSIPDFFEKLQSYDRSIKNKLRQMPELIIK